MTLHSHLHWALSEERPWDLTVSPNLSWEAAHCATLHMLARVNVHWTVSFSFNGPIWIPSKSWAAHHDLHECASDAFKWKWCVPSWNCVTSATSQLMATPKQTANFVFQIVHPWTKCTTTYQPGSHRTDLVSNAQSFFLQLNAHKLLPTRHENRDLSNRHIKIIRW